MRFPHLAHRSAAAHKLHSTPQQDGINLISGNHQTISRLPVLAYSSPEAVQTTGTIAVESAPLLTKLAEVKLGEARERLPAGICILDRAPHACSGAAMR